MSHFEVYLHGTVPASQVPALIERIAGLNGQAPLLLAFGADSFAIAEHEIVYKDGSSQNLGGSLRVRGDWMKERSVDVNHVKWDLLFIASPQPPKPGQVASIRAVYDAPVLKGNVLEHLELMDYELAFEFMRKGYRFYYGNICITVSWIHRFQSKHQTSSLMPLDSSGTWLVELSADRTHNENIPFVADQLARFARNLRGLVELGIVDVNKFRGPPGSR
ncbi:Med18 protein-domain-containing protein [Obelidium mucronatum]|nr:Med18 protein-domain-containing protein [Obelidium mucronatum]